MSNVKIDLVVLPKFNARRYFTALIFIGALMVPGIIMKSDAMQWLAFLIIVLMALQKISQNSKSGSGLTIEEVRKRLDELEKESVK